MTEELDWKGDPLPDKNEIRVNLERARGEYAVGREKIRASIATGLANMRAVANDPELRARAADLSRVTGRDVDEIIMEHVQPAIDEYEARLVAHDNDTEHHALQLPSGAARGAVTEAFFKNLGNAK